MAKKDRVRRAQLAREEARETIDEQSQTLSDIDEKAMQIFRANVVLAGIIVSGISIAVNSDSATTTALLNPFTKFGAALLFTATVFAAITYTSTTEEIGVNADDITERILNDRFDYDLIEEALAEEYSVWIASNYRANTQNVLLFTVTLVATVMAIYYFFIGAIEIYRDPSPIYTNVGAVGLFLIVSKVSKFWEQLNRWRRRTNPRKRFHNWITTWKDRLVPDDGATAENDGDDEYDNDIDDSTPDEADESEDQQDEAVEVTD